MKPKGFSLIELMVVIAIIALLVAILLPSLDAARRLSRQLALETAVEKLEEYEGERRQQSLVAWEDELQKRRLLKKPEIKPEIKPELNCNCDGYCRFPMVTASRSECKTDVKTEANNDNVVMLAASWGVVSEKDFVRLTTYLPPQWTETEVQQAIAATALALAVPVIDDQVAVVVPVIDDQVAVVVPVIDDQMAEEICARLDQMTELMLAQSSVAPKTKTKTKTDRLDNAIEGKFRLLEKRIGPLTEQMIEEERFGQAVQAGGGLLFAVLFGIAIAIFQRFSNMCASQGDKEFCKVFSMCVGLVGIIISLIIFVVQLSDAMTPVFSLMSNLR